MTELFRRERQRKTDLAPYSTYELLFELVSRIRTTNDLQKAGVRQLLIVSRACIEELGRRAQREGEAIRP